MNFILEYKKYFMEYPKKKPQKNEVSVGDNVNIKYWYNGMITPVEVIGKIGRKLVVSHNNSLSKIFNAPDEVIEKSKIYQESNSERKF